ncbi:hypothetical protein ZHAS_00004988 [Anopheles sinensis]|uniref:Tetratricopeptide repeat protein 29 n=1 Tax=Anopheles sinensis TaxID=74873 RepID=A0A084VIM6_ANOSI|nr:hypothetical protein ZHAS_00004988 [Anopheles sinensis]
MSSQDLIRPGLTTPFTGHLAQIKLRLRKKVPKLTANDVRRARIPYYEAIASELYEEGCVNAAFLVLHLIEYEDQYVQPTSDPAVEDHRLRHSRSLLDFFRESLATAEANMQLERFDSEVSELLAIARNLTRDSEKHWLARQFFLIALDRCIDCSPDGRIKWDALVRYYYAEFLIKQRNHLEAMKMLEHATTSLEKAKMEETLTTLDENGERLIVAISTLLFDVNRQLAEDCKTATAWIREQYIRDAHKAALKTLKPSIMAEAFFAYGRFLFSKRQYREALEKYNQAFQQAELDGGKEELLCSVTLARAATYHRLRQPMKCEAMLQLVDRRTRSEQVPVSSLCRADYYYTAATLELEDDPSEPERIEWLADRLRQAANTFRHFGREDKTIAARCLEALVRGEQSFGEYATELLPAAASTSDDALFRVIDWVGF